MGVYRLMTRTAASRRSLSNRRSSLSSVQRFVDFNHDGVQYVLDVDRNKVYRNWMAVETNKGFTILGAYRQSVSLVV